MLIRSISIIGEATVFFNSIPLPTNIKSIKSAFMPYEAIFDRKQSGARYACVYCINSVMDGAT